MGVNYLSWIGRARTLTTADKQRRAAHIWKHINRKPTTVTLRTAAGANRATQTVRIEPSSSVGEVVSAAGSSPIREVIVFGVKNHATVADTVMAEGDTFVLDNDLYRIREVIVQTGQIQGIARANG